MSPALFNARKGMLQRFIFALFSEGPPATNRENHEGSLRLLALRPLLAGNSRALPFPSWGRLSENIPLEPPRKRKGEVFTLRLAYSCSERPKKRELSPAATMPPTSTAKCSRPLEPDTCIFPGYRGKLFDKRRFRPACPAALEAMRKVIPSLALSDGQIVCDAFELLSYVRRKSR